MKLGSSNVITRLLHVVKRAMERVVDTFTPRLHSTTSICYLITGRPLQNGYFGLRYDSDAFGQMDYIIHLEGLLISTFLFAGIQENICDLAL